MDVQQRWRLVLGRYSEQRLTGLSDAAGQMDAALDFLYGRLYEGRGVRGRSEGERDADLSASAPSLIDWLDTVHRLFPADVCERIERDALDRFGLTELLSDPRALATVTPSVEMAKLLMAMRQRLPAASLHQVRRIIAAVVDDVMRRVRPQVAPVLAGRVDQLRRTRRNTGTIDAARTVAQNLHTWDPVRQRLLIEEVTFRDRNRLRYPWDVILCIDQSGSMGESLINSAVTAGVLAGLPSVNVKLVVFDTSVVDLTTLADDPVETLLSVQLGGGTDIAKALRYCEQLVENPTRTVVALVTDFYEGGSVTDLVASAARLHEARVTTLGLAALEDGGGPAYDRRVAARLASVGMEIGAMSPGHFAEWLAGVMR